MKRLFFYILNWAVMVVMLLAFVGINVTKLYCAHCEEDHVHVNVVSENKNCCESECECCKVGCDVPDCSFQEESYHLFYKITESVEAKEKIHLDISPFFLLEYQTLFFASEIDGFAGTLLLPDIIPDTSPSQALLCIFRC